MIIRNEQIISYLQIVLDGVDVSSNQQLMNSLLPILIAPNHFRPPIINNNQDAVLNSLFRRFGQSNHMAVLLQELQNRPNNSNELILEILNRQLTESQGRLGSEANPSNLLDQPILPLATQGASDSALAEEDLHRAIAESMNQTYRTGSIELPSYGPNAERAAELGEDIEIPEHYFCPLSQCVMTQPVYDLRSKTYFEKAWIMKELEINPHNPCTRQPLTSEELKFDQKLAKEIDDYLTEKENEKARRMAP